MFHLGKLKKIQKKCTVRPPLTSSKTLTTQLAINSKCEIKCETITKRKPTTELCVINKQKIVDI